MESFETMLTQLYEKIVQYFTYKEIFPDIEPRFQVSDIGPVRLVIQVRVNLTPQEILERQEKFDQWWFKQPKEFRRGIVIDIIPNQN